MKKKIKPNLQNEKNTEINDICISDNTLALDNDNKEDIIPTKENQKVKNESKKAVLGRKQEKFITFQKLYEECKLKVLYPELLEFEDPTSKDFILLNTLKAIPNSVSVPRHWKLKRDYLSSKRATYKKPYLVPSHIVQTGICEARNINIKQKVNIPLKSKLKQKLHPKIDKKEIEYSKVKYYGYNPKLTSFGEVHYEDKYQGNYFTGQKPGVLSIELREALGMKEDDPVPWIEKIKKYGEPPAYPGFRILGSSTDLQRNLSCSFGKKTSEFLKSEKEQSSVVLKERFNELYILQEKQKLFFSPEDLIIIKPQKILIGKKNNNEKPRKPKIFCKAKEIFVEDSTENI